MSALHGLRESLLRLSELLEGAIISNDEYVSYKASLIDYYIGAPAPLKHPSYAPTHSPPNTSAPSTNSYRSTPSDPPPFRATGRPPAPPTRAWTPPTRPWAAPLCHNCGASDHQDQQCFQPRACFHCKEFDHNVSQCPLLSSPPPVEAGRPAARRLRCHNCRGSGHFARDCPVPEVCHNCGAQDHKVRQCPYPAVCHGCGEPGHRLRECRSRAPQLLTFIRPEEGSATRSHSQTTPPSGHAYTSASDQGQSSSDSKSSQPVSP